MKALRAVQRAFERVAPTVAWFEFVGGLVCLLLTWPLRVLPPFSDHPGNLLITCVGWLIVAQEGFGQITDPDQ